MKKKNSASRPEFMGMPLDEPAVKLSINGKIHCDWQSDSNGNFFSGPLRLRVEYFAIPGGFRKHLELCTTTKLPTPDYLIVDYRFVSDPNLRRCGYQASDSSTKGRPGEEEGGGIMPGCGYPLIGNRCFVGLEHQAGFNTVLEQNESGTWYELRQHPVWNGTRLETMDAVLVAADNPEAAFRRYLDTIRLPDPPDPIFSFCSFWSEPYLGKYEYRIDQDNYRSFVRAFARLGLRPDVYTLDAGWQDRYTVFGTKAECDGDEGLVKLRKLLNRCGSKLSLWVSHNGPMGIAPEYLKTLGIAVGSGESSTYCGSGYGVLMDEKLESLLIKRFCELAGARFRVVHFKMDWDNDCATAPEFREKYPTRNHVREASVQVQNRIAAAIRQVNPHVVLRHGWWPSPWQLCHSNHLFLSDSGDCEYSSCPALDQRDSSLTARDIQYYNHLCRDHGMIPLSCIDNHDFPQAPRNPFTGNDAVWSNTALLSVMRGSNYLPWKLQPEALEPSQIAILRAVMEFARKNARHIFVRNGKMVGGHPAHGEIYGFLQQGPSESWCVLRNPAPLPQYCSLNVEQLSGNLACQILQIYPDCREIPVSGETLFTAHELKILIFSKRRRSLPWDIPFQIRQEENGYVCRFPASACVTNSVRPIVAPVYQMKELEFGDISTEQTPEFKRFLFRLRSPYRMREFQLQFRISGASVKRIRMELHNSRFPGASGCCYALPVTEIFASLPGLGERRNPDGNNPEEVRFFTTPVPCGGDTYFRLDLYGPFVELELWATGFEAPSREGIVRRKSPVGISVLPPPHPFGFPRAIRLTEKP